LGEQDKSEQVPSTRSEKVDAALSIVSLQWEAEQENSRRLATRANGILATIAVLSGLGLFKFPEAGPESPYWVRVTVKACIVLVAVFLVLGLVHILDLRAPRKTDDEPWWRLGRKIFRWVRSVSRPIDHGPEIEKRKHPFASSILQGQREPESAIDDPDLLQLKLEAIRETHYYRLAMASIELHVRNVERQAAIVRGQAWLAKAAFVAFALAVLLAVFR
jgi:hypothetical protein